MTRRRYLPACAAALAPVLLVSSMVAKAENYPSKGMTSAQVERTFGHPRSKSAPSGLPPITHWVYDNFTVYFDRDRVIFHIKSSGPPEPVAAIATSGRLKTPKPVKPAKVPAAPATVAPVAAAAPVVTPRPAAAPVAAAAPAAAVPAATPAATTDNNDHIAALMAAEQSRKAAEKPVAKPVEQKPPEHKPLVLSPTANAEPTVKAVAPLKAARAGLMRVLHEDGAWYAGVVGGTSNFSTLATAECNGALVKAGFSASNCGEASGSQTLKLYAGYNLIPLLGVELGVTQIGSSNYSTVVDQTTNIGTEDQVSISGKVKAHAFNTNLVVNLHPDRAEKATIGIKLGAYMAYHEISSTASGKSADTRDNLNHSFSNSSTLLGLRASYKLFGGMAATAEWDRFRNLGIANQSGTRDVDTFLAGLQYTF